MFWCSAIALSKNRKMLPDHVVFRCLYHVVPFPHPPEAALLKPDYPLLSTLSEIDRPEDLQLLQQVNA